MVFSLVSSCPDCGAPIWANLADQSENNPPQSRFTCECRFEKDPLPTPQVAPFKWSRTYPPITLPDEWEQRDLTQTPPNYMGIQWTGDTPMNSIPRVFS